MQIYSGENIIENVAEFINTNFALKKIAIFVDEDKNNQNTSLELQKLISNKVIENKPITEDVAFCVICGNYLFQQQCLEKITKCNLPYGYIISNLGQSSFLMPIIQNQQLKEIYNAEFVAFDKKQIKKQSFSCNLAVISFLQSQKVMFFEKEFYAKVFNAHYVLECKDKLLKICDSINGIIQHKYKNVQNANLKIADAVIKLLKLQTKYEFLQENNAIMQLANNLTQSVFNNVYENTFISSVFSVSLLQKYFALTFDNYYTFSYEKNLEYSNQDFNLTIQEYKKSQVNKDLCYKLLFNKQDCLTQLFQINTKLFLNKYDFLCIFDDFGYKLANILKKCNIKQAILKVANLNQENIFKQIRNVGLLDF